MWPKASCDINHCVRLPAAMVAQKCLLKTMNEVSVYLYGNTLYLHIFTTN